MAFKKGDLIKTAHREWLYFVTDTYAHSNQFFAMPQNYECSSQDHRGYYYYDDDGFELCSDILRSLYEK